MSASICQRPSSIDRRDKRLGNGQARSRRHRIKRAVGPIRPRSFRVQPNYLDALNASRVRIHRQKPKALGLSSAADLRGISSIKVLRLRDINHLDAALLPRKLKPEPLTRSTTLARGRKRWRGDRMRRVAAQCSAISDVGSHFSRQALGDDHPCCAGRPAGVCCFHAGGAVNRR